MILGCLHIWKQNEWRWLASVNNIRNTPPCHLFSSFHFYCFILIVIHFLAFCQHLRFLPDSVIFTSVCAFWPDSVFFFASVCAFGQNLIFFILYIYFFYRVCAFCHMLTLHKEGDVMCNAPSHVDTLIHSPEVGFDEVKFYTVGLRSVQVFNTGVMIHITWFWTCNEELVCEILPYSLSTCVTELAIRNYTQMKKGPQL